MKNIAKNAIGYTGIVTISRYNHNKKVEIAKVHNEGRNPLFDFLASCLIGDYALASAYIPNKVRLLYTGSSGEISAASGFIHMTTPPEKITDEKKSCARYSFLIPADRIESAFNGIGLYTKAATDKIDELEDFAAYCKIPSIGSDSTALVIDWELIISNTDDKETTNV